MISDNALIIFLIRFRNLQPELTVTQKFHAFDLLSIKKKKITSILCKTKRREE